MSAKNDTEPQPVCRLASIRKQRNIPVADLARAIGVSRQTIYAIEDGSYVPNTSVALRLGRMLSVTVEDLFSLPDKSEGLLQADLLSPTAGGLREGQPVRLCRVEDRLVAIPSSVLPTYLPQCDAVVSTARGESVSVLSPTGVQHGERFLLAGCDPALSLVGETLQASRIDLLSVAAASQRALTWLYEGKIHAAGSHLLDSQTGTYNIPQIRRQFQAGSVRVVTFASWRQGLLVKAGNPKQLSGIADLARRGVTFVNREEGSGSRKLLDSEMHRSGIPPKSIRAYNVIASGHLDVARRIASGEADAGIATESAARCFGLDFLPLAEERFDLAFNESSLTLPTAQAILNTLANGAFRAKLRLIAGYDTSETGKVQL